MGFGFAIMPIKLKTFNGYLAHAYQFLTLSVQLTIMGVTNQSVQQTQSRVFWISLSLLVSLVLCVAKFTAWHLTSSSAILTDALESIINVIATCFALYSVYLASKPKDSNHPYGHGKVEFFSAGVEGAMILIAGVFILIKAFGNIFDPQPVLKIGWGLALTAFSTAGNLIMGRLLVKKGRQLNSLTLYADGKHLLSDSYSSGLIILGLLIINYTGWYLLDVVLSAILALIIIYNGYKLMRKSLSGLMDEADETLLSDIVDLLNRNRQPNWIDVHNLRVQRYGANLHIDCHLTLPNSLTFEQVHEEVRGFEKQLQNAFDGYVEVFVHADPSSHLPDLSRKWTLKNIVTNKRFG